MHSVSRTAILAALLLTTSAALPQESIEWINSAEAYFATAAERSEWFRLANEAQRQAFKERYWRVRDPTPDTAKNEFKEVILDRIKKADAKFSIAGGLNGAETAQGLVYIVFGPPARVRTQYTPPPPRPRPPDQPPAVGVGVSEGTETTSLWIYDRERTPHLLEMIGRPGLEITILIEPNKRRDIIQSPGVVDHYRDVLAERSIVNPEFNVAIATPVLGIASPRIDANIPDSIRALLRDAKPAAPIPAVTFTAADVWNGRQTGAVITIAVTAADDRTTHLTTYGVVREGVRIVATLAAPFTTTDAVSSATGSRATAMRLDLPPGSYEGSFALVDDRTNEPLYVTAAPLRVSDPATAFDVSSLVISGQPAHGKSAPFSFGDLAVTPRADLLFARKESLWYFATIRSADGSAGITVELQLRHAGKTVARSAFRPHLGEIAAGVFLLGQELPLAQFEPGDYSLYLLLHSPKSATEVRRADFRIRD